MVIQILYRGEDKNGLKTLSRYSLILDCIGFQWDTENSTLKIERSRGSSETLQMHSPGEALKAYETLLDAAKTDGFASFQLL